MQENDYPGIFIVIEGPDASGKETQTGRIVKWFREKELASIDPEKEQKIIERMPGNYLNSQENKVKDNIEDGVWRLSFPTYGQTPGGRIVEAYLNGEFGDRDKLSMELIVDIYAADRKQFKELITEFLDNGGIIVCDRYREANLIHQLVGFEGEEWEEKLEYIKGIDSDLPDADEIFYLDIDPEVALERMADKDKDMHELNSDYMRASNENGRKVAEKEDWCVIDAERSRDKVEDALIEKITNVVS